MGGFKLPASANPFWWKFNPSLLCGRRISRCCVWRAGDFAERRERSRNGADAYPFENGVGVSRIEEEKPSQRTGCADHCLWHKITMVEVGRSALSILVRHRDVCLVVLSCNSGFAGGCSWNCQRHAAQDMVSLQSIIRIIPTSVGCVCTCRLWCRHHWRYRQQARSWVFGVPRYQWIDLGYDDNNIGGLIGWVTVYFLGLLRQKFHIFSNNNMTRNQNIITILSIVTLALVVGRATTCTPRSRGWRKPARTFPALHAASKCQLHGRRVHYPNQHDRPIHPLNLRPCHPVWSGAANRRDESARHWRRCPCRYLQLRSRRCHPTYCGSTSQNKP